MTTPPVRHGWLKHLIAGLEDDPHTQHLVNSTMPPAGSRDPPFPGDVPSAMGAVKWQSGAHQKECHS